MDPSEEGKLLIASPVYSVQITFQSIVHNKQLIELSKRTPC